MEIWKDIKNYEVIYQISSMGRVKSLPKKRRYGAGYQEEMFLKGKNNQGYLQVNLYNVNGMKSYQVHRLVAQTFIENLENKKEVNHKNGVKTDNRVENLEWVTPKENIKHAWDTGLMKSKQTKTKIAQYTLDGKFLKVWNGVKSIEKNLGFDYTGIIHCCKLRYKSSHGYVWRYVK